MTRLPVINMSRESLWRYNCKLISTCSAMQLFSLKEKLSTRAKWIGTLGSGANPWIFELSVQQSVIKNHAFLVHMLQFFSPQRTLLGELVHQSSHRHSLWWSSPQRLEVCLNWSALYPATWPTHAGRRPTLA